MEDRKFADIGNTCSLQLGGGAYRIAEWADIVTAHALPGPSILNALAGVAVVLVAEMSSEGRLTTAEYAQGRCAINWNTGLLCILLPWLQQQHRWQRNILILWWVWSVKRNY